MGEGATGTAERDTARRHPGVKSKDVKLKLTPILYGRFVDLAFKNGYLNPRELLGDMVRLVTLLGVSDHIREICRIPSAPKHEEPGV